MQLHLYDSYYRWLSCCSTSFYTFITRLKCLLKSFPIRKTSLYKRYIVFAAPFLLKWKQQVIIACTIDWDSVCTGFTPEPASLTHRVKTSTSVPAESPIMTLTRRNILYFLSRQSHLRCYYKFHQWPPCRRKTSSVTSIASWIYLSSGLKWEQNMGIKSWIIHFTLNCCKIKFTLIYI